MFLRAISLPVLSAIGAGPAGPAAAEAGSDTGRKFSLASGNAQGIGKVE
jgi:NADPH-dependent 2,4-dienoyl-CoA reductase/sulfur reductase-like enzyme